jgi:SSS family solute:Na+ symporter
MSYTLGAVIGTSIVLFYSLFGGFRGVVLTDLLQFVFFLLGAIALCVFTYFESGGWDVVHAHAMSIGKSDYTSFWSRVPDYLAYIFTFGTSWTIQANVWQRISAAKNEKSAKNMMIISFFVFIPLYLMVTLTGMFSSVLFDTLPEGGIVPQIILQLNSPFWSALIFVGLCSAIMSTMDSMINTGALSLSVDIYQKYINKKTSPKKNVLIARISTLIIALLALFIGIKVESVLTVSWIGADFLATGAFVPLIGGFIWKRGSSRAATASMTFGFIFCIYNLLITMGYPLPTAWEAASVYQALIGMTISFVIYVSVSLFPCKKIKGKGCDVN